MFDFFSPSRPPRPPLRRSPTLKDEMGRTRPERIEGAKGPLRCDFSQFSVGAIFTRGELHDTPLLLLLCLRTDAAKPWQVGKALG